MSNTVCAYCGVGCRFDSIDGKLKGKDGSCAKGISQVKSIHSNRLTQTKMRATIEDTFQNSSYDEALEVIASKLKATNPNKVGFYLSGQMLNEDYYVANKLAKGFVGTAHCDTNSRTCMASAVVGYKKAYGLDYVPVVISDIDNCNLMIIIGGNPAESHVVLFNKIKKAQKKGMRVVVIDPRKTLSAMSADLYLPLKVGSDIDLLNLLSLRLIKEDKIDKDFIKNHVNSYQDYHDNLILNDEKTLLSATGLDKELFEKFYMLFITSKNIITAWTMGINQASQGVDKNLAIHNLHILTGQINKAGSGPFSLTGQPNAMGGREVGGLSTTLAVHLDYTKENCEKVSQFWKSNTLPKENGLTAFEMIEQGELEVLIICHTDPVYHLPNRHLVEDALKKINLVVEINAYEGSQSVNFSHIQIPVTAFGQKEGTQTNLERRVSIVEAFEDKNCLMSTLKIKIDDREEIENTNCVKVITDINNNAIYFSRLPLPYEREKTDIDFYKHIGIYGYRKEFLLKYVTMKPTKLELSESLEQLRVIENGYKIKVLETNENFIGVDTMEDLEKVREILK